MAELQTEAGGQQPAEVLWRSGRGIARTGSQQQQCTASQRWLMVMVVLMASLMERGGVQLSLCGRIQDEQRSSSSVDQVRGYGGEYTATLVGDNLLHAGAPTYNGKRARKTSGFMPMRGRKDGRVQQPVYLPASFEFGDMYAAASPAPFRDNDGEMSILRIAAAGNGAEQTPARWPGALMARQYANQFAMRNLMAAGDRGPSNRRAAVGDGGEETSVEPTPLVVVGDSMMQAKLRRAFHPMRGKKSHLDARSLADEQPTYASSDGYDDDDEY